MQTLRQGISDEDIIALLRDPVHDGDEKARRAAIAAALCATFGLKSLRIWKHLGDPPSFHMAANGYEITIGRVAGLLLQGKFRNHVCESAGVMIPRPASKAVWEIWAEALLRIVEEVDLGEASHPTHQTKEWLRIYLSGCAIAPSDQKDAAVHEGRPFWREEAIFIYVNDFRKWMSRETGDALDAGKICADFHAIRMEHCREHYYMPAKGQYYSRKEKEAEKGKRTTRSYWRMPPSLVEELGRRFRSESTGGWRPRSLLKGHGSAPLPIPALQEVPNLRGVQPEGVVRCEDGNSPDKSRSSYPEFCSRWS